MRSLISKPNLSPFHCAASLAVSLALIGGDISLAQAQTRNTGGVPVRIDGGPPARCINGSTDQIWLRLDRVVMTKKFAWFANNDQAQVVITVQVKTRTASTTQSLSYPLSTKVNIRDYETGQVSLPVEYMLINQFDLKQKGIDNKDVTYTGLGIDTTVINVKSSGALSLTLSALAEITGSQKLPIPQTPYTQAASYLLDFANKTVTSEINRQNGDDKYATASLALAFDPDGKCSEDGQGFESTGVKAILMAEGTPGPAYVPIDQTGDYCWTADTKPSFVLKAAKKVAGKECTDTSSYKALYKTITNNYVAYSLWKRSSGGSLGPSQARQDLQEARQFCEALNTEDCPPARP